jgi:hypothetical protein
MERGCSGWRCCFVDDFRIFWFVEFGAWDGGEVDFGLGTCNLESQSESETWTPNFGLVGSVACSMEPEFTALPVT